MCVFRPLHGRPILPRTESKRCSPEERRCTSVFAWTAKSDEESSRRKRPCDRAISEPAVQFGPPTYLQFLERELQATQQQVVDLQQRLEGVDAVVRQFSLGRFKDNPEKMAFYTGLPDGRAFDVLWEYLDASEDTLVTVRQLPDDQRKQSRRR